jgi:hypothetical protein
MAYWTEIEMRAPTRLGTAAFVVRFGPTALDEQHGGASFPFRVSVVAKPEHMLTVKVSAGGAPIEEAYIHLSRYRAITDAAGMAQVKTATGDYELVIWKAGYDLPARPVTIETDAIVAIDARALPEDDPDSVWTA